VVSAKASASEKESTTCTAATGPKVSSSVTVIPGVTPVRTVGG
jgi:hypothetical protein